MSLVENTLRDCLSSITSSKVMERKKGVEILCDYLQKKNVKQILNTHSAADSGSSLSWDSVFTSVHHIALLEADKVHQELEKNKVSATHEVTKEKCASLVSDVVIQANSDIPYLTCNILLDAVLQVLEKNVYVNVIGHTYINILRNSILPCEKYWNKISESHWKDLCEVSFKLYERPPTKCNGSTIIGVLNLIIKHGCAHSSLVLVLKKRIFTFLKGVLQNMNSKSSIDLQQNVLLLMVTACKQLQQECRTAVCQFGEEVLESALLMYVQKMAGVAEKKNVLFEFLLIIVKAHHPNGATDNSEAAYAYNWCEWKRGLRRINYITILEIDAILEHGKLDSLPQHFLDLTVLVYKQIFHEGNALDVTVNQTIPYQAPAKRMRITSGFPDIVERLNKVTNRADMWPWLAVLHNLLSEHPSLVNEEDYTCLLQNISNLLSTCKDTLVTEWLCRCCIPLIDIRQKLNHVDTVLEQTILESIWQTVLRTVGLNQCVQWSHTLLQNFLKFWWKPSMATSILKLYLNGTIRLSKDSLRSLCHLRERISFPTGNTQISVWSSLLGWAFPNVPVNEYCFLELPKDPYAHTLIRICLKNNVQNLYVETEPINLDLDNGSCVVVDEGSISAEDIFALTSYESDLFIKDEQTESKTCEDRKNCSILNMEAFEQLIRLIEGKSEALVEFCMKSVNNVEKFNYISAFILLLLHIEKFQELYDIPSNDRLTNIKDFHIKNALQLVTSAMDSAVRLTVKQEVLACLCEFFKNVGTLPLSIVESTLTCFFPLLRPVFGIVEEMDANLGKSRDHAELAWNNSDSEQPSEKLSVKPSLLSLKKLTPNELVGVEACKVLSYYSYNREGLSVIQYKVLKSLLETLNGQLKTNTSICLFQMSVVAVSATLRLKKIDADLMGIVTEILRSFCDPGEWHTVEETAFVILCLIQYGIEKHREIVDETLWSHFKILINGIRVQAGEMGGRIISEIVRCHGLLIWSNNLTTESISRNQIEEICFLIFDYIKHPLHEVRITAISFIPKVFKLADLSYEMNMCILQKEKIFQVFTNVLLEVFLIDSDLIEELDEAVNRPLTVIYSLSCVIGHSKLVRRQALLLLFRLTTEKKLNAALACRMLNMLQTRLKFRDGMSLVKQNSMHLFWMWYKECSQSFVDFPFEIVSCRTRKMFYEEFLQVIVPVLMFYGKMDEVTGIADELETSLVGVMSLCFPDILAMLLRKIIDNETATQGERNGATEKDIHNIVENAFGKEEFSKMMMEKLPDILICVFRYLHDPLFEIPTNTILPEPMPFYSDEKQVLETIEYLQSTSVRPDEPLIVFIACGFEEYAQQIIQALYIDVVCSSTPELKMESFQRYVLFCRLLLPYYKELCTANMVGFVTRTMIYNLMHFVSGESSELGVSVAALKFFQDFTSLWLSGEENRPIVIEVYNMCLGMIVDKLVAWISAHKNALGIEAQNVLMQLLVQKAEPLRGSIQTLEPFPDLPQFEDMKVRYMELQDTQTEESTLMNEMQRFLKTVQNSGHSSGRLESLRHLRKQICAFKKDLNKIFKHLDSSRGFSDERTGTTPHKLICKLVEMSGVGGNDEVKYEAACCLGEIGLVDLHTWVLKSSYEEDDDNGLEASLSLSLKICRMLKDCIVDEDVDVLRNASRTMYVTLTSVEGYTVAKENLENMEKLFIYPFFTLLGSETTNFWTFFDSPKFMQNVNRSTLWLPMDGNLEYEGWIVNIVCAILDAFEKPCFLNVAQSVCRLKASFAEEIFKYLINLVLKTDYKEVKDALSDRINEFFMSYFEIKSSEDSCDSFQSTSSGKSIKIDTSPNKRSVQCMLDMVHFVRLRQEELHFNDLKLNYLYVAKAAQFCSLYFTSILYAELWINSQIQDSNIEISGSVSSVLEKMSDTFQNENNELLSVLRKAFSKIGDTDALYGCGSPLLLKAKTRVVHYLQTENWNRVMEACDTELAGNLHSYTMINDLSAAIRLSGLDYLQHQILSSLPGLSCPLKEASYENGWKLGIWDLPEPNDDEKSFGYYQYAALKDIHERNFEGARINAEKARRFVMPSLAGVGLESTKNIYHVLSKLQCLQDLENYVNDQDSNRNIDLWRKQEQLSCNINFHHKQIVLDQRVHLMGAVDGGAAAGNYILNLAKSARTEGNFKCAESYIAAIRRKSIQSSSKLFNFKLILEEAKILWQRKEHYEARYVLRDLLKRSDFGKTGPFHSTLLITYGKWLSEINLENADTIFDEFFLPSSEAVLNREENEKERKARLKAYKCVGEYADSQYQQISKYVKSDDFAKQQRIAVEAKRQAEALHADSTDLRRTKIQLANQSKIDNSLVKEMKEKEKRYLIWAMRYYLKLLAESDGEDLTMFRVISLWLENKKHAELHMEMREPIMIIPSYKFILVLPQLMAHITRDTAECFGNFLNRIIEKCAQEHPHHTLPMVLSLAKYRRDEEFSGERKVSKEERVLAALENMKKFRNMPKINEIVKQMESMSDAIIQFAYASSPPTVKCGEKSSISTSQPITKLKNLDLVQCPTVSLPVNKSGEYYNIVGIRYIEPKFMSVGGINAPKKIQCICTDGKERSQLVKGRDDIRQDAVMQQVFTIMNKLLSENKHTSKRKLLIRTYKVIPLSQRSGILEWCVDTISLSEYLAGSQKSPGAHQKYRPKDLQTDKARAMINKTSANSDEKRLEIFKEVCSRLKPVFRYFFTEKYPSPSMWFERKLAYIHSVAVTSMVGYIIGLGDRHPQNILIDEKTAEVIHIDFGIAFEQGLFLRMPEYNIPFRLTRDIEDGMGVFAIDGIFRRCCEQTLAVLRQNRNIIQTTLEVFLYDPLYQWTVTPEKKALVQKTTTKNVDHSVLDVTAPRALDSIRLKLQGLEEGTATTIEGQVNRLIQKAKDPNNLSKLFHGWQAFL